MGKNVNANKPCPCGSGKKYKKCCMRREDDPNFSNPVNLIKSYKAVRKEAKIKQCLYPDHTLCSEAIINAHSIQNNKILKQISSNGDVYMPCPKSDNPFALITKWGRKQATVFTGFCGYHDNELFKPIENNSFDKSPLHIFLYTYRCFAIEYHKKQEVTAMQQGIFRRKPSLINMPPDQNPFRGVATAVKDFYPVKKEFDKALIDKDYDILTSIVWEFNQSIKFAGTGFEAIERDLEHNKIQDLLDFDQEVKHIFMMVFPEETKTYCIISWLKTNDYMFSKFYNQLLSLDEEHKKHYINHTLPTMSENIAINPTAWDSWDKQKKDEFNSLIFGASTIAEHALGGYDRLSAPSFDLFNCKVHLKIEDISQSYFVLHFAKLYICYLHKPLYCQ